MKVLLTIWISVILIQEVVPSTLVRRPRSVINNTSLIHTEYEAKYEQKGKHGNQSLSTVTGNHQIVHDNCSENWNVFAEKCASLIKDLISTLANAVQSNPGDATNLQLHIRNTFKHFDTTHNCTCLNDTGNSLSDVNVSPLFQNITINTKPPGSNNTQGSGNSQCGGDGQSCDGNSGSGNAAVVVDPAAVSQQRKPNGLSENSDVNPSNAANSNGDSTNNSRRQADYPRVLKQPQNSFKNSAPANGNAQRLTSKLPQNNKSSVPPFLVTPLPNYHPAKSSQAPIAVVPNTASGNSGVPSSTSSTGSTPASASQVLASPSNGNSASKNSVPVVLVKPQQSGGNGQGQNLGKAQPSVGMPQVAPVNSNKNSAWPLSGSRTSATSNKNLKPAVILPVPKNNNSAPKVAAPTEPAKSNSQSSSSVPIINSDSNLPEPSDSDCDDEDSKSQSPVNVPVLTGSNSNPGILSNGGDSLPASNTKQPVPEPNSISKVKIIPTVPVAANQKTGNSAVPVTNSPTGEGDDCEGDELPANTNDNNGNGNGNKTPVLSVPLKTDIGSGQPSGAGDEESCDDDAGNIPAVGQTTDNGNGNGNDDNLTPVVSVPVTTGTGDEEPCDDDTGNVPAVVETNGNGNGIANGLANSGNQTPVVSVPLATGTGNEQPSGTGDEEPCDDDTGNVPVGGQTTGNGNGNGNDGNQAPVVSVPVTAGTGDEEPCDDDTGNVPTVGEANGNGNGNDGKQTPVVSVSVTTKAGSEQPSGAGDEEPCDDDTVPVNNNPDQTIPTIPSSNDNLDDSDDDVETAGKRGLFDFLLRKKAASDYFDSDDSYNPSDVETPALQLPAQPKEGSSAPNEQGSQGQGKTPVLFIPGKPTVVPPSDNSQTECEDESNQNVTPAVVVPNNNGGQGQGILGQSGQRVTPAVVPSTDNAQTECDDESSQGVTPAVVVPNNNGGQGQGVTPAVIVPNNNGQGVTPAVVVPSNNPQGGSQQEVTPAVVVPNNNGGQGQGILGQFGQRVTPAVVPSSDNAQTECDDESSQGVTPAVVVPNNNGGQGQGVTPAIIVPNNNAQGVTPAVVPSSDNAQTECDDESSQGVTPAVVIPKNNGRQGQGVTPAIIVPNNNDQGVTPAVVVPNNNEQGGPQQGVTPAVVVPNNNGGQGQGILGQPGQRVTPAVVAPSDNTQTECDDDDAGQSVTPAMIVTPKPVDGPSNNGHGSQGKAVTPAVIVSSHNAQGGQAPRVTPAVFIPGKPTVVPTSDNAQTECDDESGQGVTPAVVFPNSNGGQGQGVTPAVIVPNNNDQGVTPAVVVPSNNEQSGPQQGVTPAVIVPNNNGGQGQGILGQSGQKVTPAVIPSSDNAQTECDDESSQNVTPAVVVPNNNGGQGQGILGQSGQRVTPAVVPSTDNAQTECDDESSQGVTPAVVVPNNNGGQGQGVTPAVIVPNNNAQGVTPAVVVPSNNGQGKPQQGVTPAIVVPSVIEPTAVTPAVLLPVEPTVSPNSIGQVGQGSSKDPVLTKPTTFQTTSVDPTPPPSPVYLHPTESPVAPTNPSVRPNSKGTSLSKPSTTSQAHHDDDDDDDEEDCCSCESCTEEEQITDPKVYKENACKNLEEARLELKRIFDKIRKKLKCGRKAPQTITTSLSPQLSPK